jgi:hypothetical protein
MQGLLFAYVDTLSATAAAIRDPLRNTSSKGVRNITSHRRAQYLPQRARSLPLAVLALVPLPVLSLLTRVAILVLVSLLGLAPASFLCTSIASSLLGFTLRTGFEVVEEL